MRNYFHIFYELINWLFSPEEESCCCCEDDRPVVVNCYVTTAGDTFAISESE
jgi:hypothetical protein